VVTHLQDCVACQQLRTRLQRIDQGMTRLTGPASDAAKAKLLERVAAAQQVAAPKPATPRTPWQWWRHGAYLSGAAALIAVGFWLGYEPASEPVPPQTVEVVKTVEVIRDRPVEVVREKIVTVTVPADRPLFAALLRHNAELVQTSQSLERVEALLDMAEDCRQHALTLIEQGPRDSVPMTIDLYVQVLRDGVIAQLAQAPAPLRPMLQQAARGRLDKMALPASVALALPRVVEDQRVALRSATQQMRDLVERPEDAKAKQAVRGEALSPSAALVQFAVAFSAQGDPLVRADTCAECVQRLMPSMMLCLADDASPQRLEMGQDFGAMIRFGIYAPLAVATAKEPAQPVKDQADRIFQNAAGAVAAMEDNLQKADDKAKPAIQGAIDATKKAPEKNKGKGKAKGKGKGERGDRERSFLDIDARPTLAMALTIIEPSACRRLTPDTWPLTRDS
jgi:hypothetical protein